MKIEYYPEKRAKKHEFLRLNGVKLAKGLNEITESELTKLKKYSSYTRWLEQGVLVVHKERATASKAKTAKLSVQ